MGGRCSLTGCVKLTFTVFNALFWLLGCALIGMGVWLHINKGPYVDVLAPGFNWLSATALILTTGILCVLIGFMGCYGILIENRCMLITYFLFVLFVFALEVIAALIGVCYQDELKILMKDELQYGIRAVYPIPGVDDPSGLRATWDGMQSALQCCGVTNYTDWFTCNGWKKQNWVPDTCCLDISKNCGKSKDPNKWQSKGCLEEILYVMQQQYYVLGVVAIVFAVIQIMCMVASLVLYSHLKKQLKRVTRRK
ncbi:tetraspanin-9-like [Lineus longissimus]|uniref:tetraspanin-9-like n=1 Tax=Lineus longissimus TaxID=88925 RepID=UPI002B4FA051